MRFTCLAIAAAALLATPAAQAAPLKRTPLIDQPLPAALTVRNVKGTMVDFAPGQPTGRHLHPAPVFGIVTKGSFVFQPHGQAVRILKTGEAFYEPANTPIERFDNASATEGAQIEAFYLLGSASQPTIQMLGDDKR